MHKNFQKTFELGGSKDVQKIVFFFLFNLDMFKKPTREVSRYEVRCPIHRLKNATMS